MDREEGEMSDDNMCVDDVREPVPETDSTLMYKAEKDCIVVQKLEKIDASKIEERAKRFGLNLTGNRVVTQGQIDELYSKCGIESGNERHFRFDTIHLNGINGLTTRDIFEYLEDYKPVSLEWIDDVSCNVVCQDHIAAALALLVHSREIKSKEINDMLADKSPHHWREGMPHPKKDLILMRFATNGDKKMNKKKSETKNSDNYFDQNIDSIKNPWGDLCKSWGIYDHQEIFQRKLPKHDYEDDIEEPDEVVQIKNSRLAMRLGKRTHKIEGSEDSNSDSEWKRKSKTPRMRMHADDEESKIKKKQIIPELRDTSPEKDTYAPLSIEVANYQSNYVPRQSTKLSDKFKKSGANRHKESIQARLGVKVVPEDTVFTDETSSDSSDHYIMSRVEKVTNKRSDSSVWSRLEDKPHSTSSKSDLRQILKSRKQNKSDLRGRISKSKQSNLRIEIDNNYTS